MKPIIAFGQLTLVGICYLEPRPLQAHLSRKWGPETPLTWKRSKSEARLSPWKTWPRHEAWEACTSAWELLSGCVTSAASDPSLLRMGQIAELVPDRQWGHRATQGLKKQKAKGRVRKKQDQSSLFIFWKVCLLDQQNHNYMFGLTPLASYPWTGF
jgi:hypothetical protein